MCEQCQKLPPHPIPDSWYELSSRIASAQAVASYILEAVPFGENPDQRKAAQCATGLASAVVDLLEMCEKDCERLELELKNANP